MLDSTIQVNVFLMQYCRTLLADVPDERMAEQPMAGVNHPAWILGHLAVTGEGSVEKLGGQKTLPTAWADLFRPGSKPSNVRGLYPSKDTLMQAFEKTYERLRERIAAATAEQLSRPTTNERAKRTLPTLREQLAFVLTGHVAIHLGQLSAWRRMIDLPPMF